MGMIPDSVIREIDNRVNIVDLITSYIPLRRAGRNFKALCPFHQERTPSFIVNPERQRYQCFGCGASGDALSFLMRFEHMEFPEAVRFLGEKLGVAIPEEDSPGALNRQSVQRKLFEINELAANFFEQQLWAGSGEQARVYLSETRNVTESTSKDFRIGYAPNQWDGLVTYARRQGIDSATLVKAGLAVAGSGRQPRDMFRHRVIFPIHDVRGRTIGFGARCLDGREPKYLNSPETEIYHKSRSLFGIHVASQSIHEENLAVIVEGYLDQIIPFQAGVRPIVACLGTALTSDQSRLLRRYTKRVVMVYDGDSAGLSAALRGLDLLLEEDFDVRIATLPTGFDPDTFVRKYGPEDFRSLVSQASDLIQFKTNILLKRYDIANPKEKGQLATDMLLSISKVSNSVERSEYVRRLAHQLFVKEEDMLVELRQLMKDTSVSKVSVSMRTPAPSKQVSKTPQENAEGLLVRVVMEKPSLLATVRDQLILDDLRDSTARSVLEIMLTMARDGVEISPTALRARSTASLLHQQWFDQVIGATDVIGDHTKCLEDCLRHIKRRHLRNRLHELSSSLKADGSDALSKRDLVVEYNRVLKLLGTL